MHTFQTLNLKGFITCTLQKDYSVLAETEDEKKDKFIEAREEAWTSISSDYYQLIADKNVTRYIVENDRMQVLALRIIVYTETVKVLRVVYHEPIAQYLRDEFNVQLDNEDPDQYEADLDRVLVELKADELDLERTNGQAQERKEKNEHREPSEDDYDEMLMEIYCNLIHAPLTDLEIIKTEMKVKTYTLYVKKLRQHYMDKAKKPIM